MYQTMLGQPKYIFCFGFLYKSEVLSSFFYKSEVLSFSFSFSSTLFEKILVSELYMITILWPEITIPALTLNSNMPRSEITFVRN
jgi:hypothetical protein